MTQSGPKNQSLAQSQKTPTPNPSPKDGGGEIGIVAPSADDEAREIGIDDSCLDDEARGIGFDDACPDDPGEGVGSPRTAGSSRVTFGEFQQLIRTMYHQKDAARGIDGTFMWLMEEIGELAAALRDGTHQDQLEEFADVLAWLFTIANVAGVDLTKAIVGKYGAGCPGCGEFICTCDDAGKP